MTGPLGQERDDQLHAAATAAAVAPWMEKGRKIRVADFMPAWDQKPKSDAELMELGRAWAETFGGET